MKEWFKQNFPDMYAWYKKTSYQERVTALIWFNLTIVAAAIYLYSEYRFLYG